MPVRVYGASKLKHAGLWKELRTQWPEIIWTARWPVMHVGTVPDEPCFAKVFWQHDYEDVREADVVMVYAEPQDHLRGALVEAGMCIAMGGRVIVVGDNPDYGTWQYHPQVYKAKDLAEARLLLKTMAIGES